MTWRNTHARDCTHSVVHTCFVYVSKGSKILRLNCMYIGTKTTASQLLKISLFLLCRVVDNNKKAPAVLFLSSIRQVTVTFLQDQQYACCYGTIETTFQRNFRVYFSVISLLLTLSGDTELNPGPVRFPCGRCGRAVQSNHRGILCCDQCDRWFNSYRLC